MTVPSSMCVAPHLRLKRFPTLHPPIDWESPTMKHNVYHFGKGGSDALIKEVENSFSGAPDVVLNRSDHIDSVFDALYKTWREFTFMSKPMTWEEALTVKDKDTSVGFPLCARYADFGDLIEKETMERVVAWCEELETAVCAGSYPETVWKLFPKEDKYKTKKIEENKYRVLSIGPLFLLSLCRRYYSRAESHLKVMIPQMYVITDQENFERKVFNRMRGSETFGIDYTAFDKNSCQYLVGKSFQLLDRLVGSEVPRHVYNYIFQSITQPNSMIIDEEGNQIVYGLTATNPSGEFFTTWVNTVTHIVHNASFVDTVLKVHPEDYLRDYAPLRSVCTGDDGVEAVTDSEVPNNTLNIANKLCEYISREFGIPARLDLLIDDTNEGKLCPFPKDLMAPYLNDLLVVMQERSYYRIYTNPKRLLPRLNFVTQNSIIGDVRHTLSERVDGIMERLRPNFFHEYANPSLPKNEVIQSIRTLATSLGVRPPTAQDIRGVVFQVPRLPGTK